MKRLEDGVVDTLSRLGMKGLTSSTIVPVGKELRTLAAWPLKTAAVAQELMRMKMRPIQQAARTHLYEHEEPPPGTTVWLVPSPELRLHALLATFGNSTHAWGYTAQILVGQVGLILVSSFTDPPMRFRPPAVRGVEPLPLWPTGPGWISL
jgi:hypothetical protein